MSWARQGLAQCWHSHAIVGLSSKALLCNVHGELLTGVSEEFYREAPFYRLRDRKNTPSRKRSDKEHEGDENWRDRECNDKEAALKCCVLLFSLSSYLLSNLSSPKKVIKYSLACGSKEGNLELDLTHFI